MSQHYSVCGLGLLTGPADDQSLLITSVGRFGDHVEVNVIDHLVVSAECS